MQAVFHSPSGALGTALLTLGIYIEGRAKSLCPVDTGRLRSSIGHEMGQEGSSLFVRVGSNVNYAPYVELGTRRMSAQPFLVPALAAGVAKGLRV